jgi:predicted nuclease of restriction endonuclease-like RecB superfamily
VIPHYLTETDHPWLRLLLDEHDRCLGCKKRQLGARIAESLSGRAPRAKLRMAAHVLSQLSTDAIASPVAPRRIRATLFKLAAQQPPQAALVATAKRLNVAVDRIDELLFADIPAERAVGPLQAALSVAELAGRTNTALVASLLGRAVGLSVVARGNVRALVQHAKLVGLLCVPVLVGDAGRVRLELSGPLSLFRRTLVYGRALASLVPRAAWCSEFELRADCELLRDGQRSTLVVRSGDPVAPGRELCRYDSQLEERFAQQFVRRAPDWELVREPAPLRAGQALVFPDFELRHRHDPGRRWLLEIVGFWTPEYVQRKLERLRAARISNLILCISERRACGQQAWPEHARVVRFKSRIDPAAVLSILQSPPERG